MTACEQDQQIITSFKNSAIFQQMNFSERGTWAAINGIYLRHGYISKKNLGKLKGIVENILYRQSQAKQITA